MGNTKFYAHTRTGGVDNWQPLEDHLRHVALQAAEFAAVFNSRSWGYISGLLHDLGKYSAKFQEMLYSAQFLDAHIETKRGKVDHSTAGAIHALKLFSQNPYPILMRAVAYIVAGHHAGLPDWQHEQSGDSSLQNRLGKIELYQAITRILTEIESPAPPPLPTTFPTSRLSCTMWIRMLFSCVVDADFLDTEAFVQPETTLLRAGYRDIAHLEEAFDRYMEQKMQTAPQTPTNHIRRDILRQCREKASFTPAIFTLTVPTGGGKTLSSMAFALGHARKHGKRRIIFVIPYTSIIEQTAEQYRTIFGESVIEHHSNVFHQDPALEDQRRRLACENWDAPIIVTTAVQFFESLFAARPAACRKLHNIAGSVVVIDEAQLLPPEFLTPILEAVGELQKNYGVTFVLSTATQPAFSPQPAIGFRGLADTVEIIDDPSTLHASLKRVRCHVPSSQEKPEDWPEIAARVSRHETVLCIVNSRRDCRELHRLMPPDTIHLSAVMCGAHRSACIEKIRQRLHDGSPVRVISTQLVEAGVDFDFPVVYRAMAGLDSLAQAAGRCNREGRLPYGDLFIFHPPHPPPVPHLRQAAEIGRRLLAEAADDPLGLPRFPVFFRELFWLKGEDLDRHRIVSFMLANDTQMRFHFRQVAEKFRIIDDSQSRSVLVRYDRGGEWIDELAAGGPDARLLRRLQRYTVSIPAWLHGQLAAQGDIAELERVKGCWVQVNSTLYQDSVGLLYPEETTQLLPEDLVI